MVLNYKLVFRLCFLQICNYIFEHTTNHLHYKIKFKQEFATNCNVYYLINRINKAQDNRTNFKLLNSARQYKFISVITRESNFFDYGISIFYWQIKYYYTKYIKI